MKKNRLAVLIITPCIAAALVIGTVAVINSGAFDASKLVEGTTAITMTATSAETTVDLKETVETEPTAVQTTVTAITTAETTSATIETTAPVTTTTEATTTTPPETTAETAEITTSRTERTFTPEESAAMSEVAELEKQVRQQAVSAAANTTAATTTEYTVETTAQTTASAAPKPDDADGIKDGVYFKYENNFKYLWLYDKVFGWKWEECGEGKVDYLDWGEKAGETVDWLH